MSNANQMRIQQLEGENKILLQRTEQLETKINRLKQQGVTHKKDERVLNSMVSKSLYLLAEIQTLKVVGETTISNHTFSSMINKRYQLLLDKFKQRLQYKRQQRIKRLQHFNR